MWHQIAEENERFVQRILLMNTFNFLPRYAPHPDEECFLQQIVTLIFQHPSRYID